MIGVAVVAANPITTPAYSEIAENNPVYEAAVAAEARADTPYSAEEKKGPVYKPTPAVYKKPAVYEVTLYPFNLIIAVIKKGSFISTFSSGKKCSSLHY